PRRRHRRPACRVRCLPDPGQRVHGQAGRLQSRRGQLQAAARRRQDSMGHDQRQDAAGLPMQTVGRPVCAVRFADGLQV
ncbi:LOW QUALITY PROTEIN: hypothetical protein HMPREF0005_05871, partial [Achromobacter xylosoxidans C54]